MEATSWVFDESCQLVRLLTNAFVELLTYIIVLTRACH
jgi:hypothetical protein